MRFTRENEIDMINDPKKWPMWPFLPLKKHGQTGFLSCAVLIEQKRENNEIKIFKGVTIYDNIEKIKSSESETFPNTEALVDAGWMVD